MRTSKGRIPANDTLMSGAMLGQAVAEIMTHIRVDRAHNVPYLAGYSEDGRTIYIDKDLPKSFALGRRRIQVDRYLILHEAVEKALLDRLRLSYQHAHQIALRAEQAAVRADGIEWRAYDKFMQRHIKEAGDDVDHLPTDLEVKPYRDERDFELLKKMLAQMRKGKRKRPRNSKIRPR